MTIKIEKLHFTLRILLLLLLCVLFITMFSPFMIPMLMAAFFALGCEPLIQKIHVSTKSKPKRRRYFMLVLFVVMLVILLVPLTVFIVRALKGLKSISAESLQNSQMFQALFGLWEKLQGYGVKAIETFGLDVGVIPQKDELIGKISPIVLEKITVFLGSIPDLMLSLFVFFCMLFIFISNANQIKNYILQINVMPEFEVNVITRSLQNGCSMVLVSTLLIGALQALIVAIGSSVFGYHEFFLIFTITFFLSFIPVIGAAPIAGLLAIISFIMGNSTDGIGLIVVTVIAGSIDNILKPYVFSNMEANLHPLISLFGIIGAIIVFGLPGLLIGPLLLQVTLQVVPPIAKRIFT